MKKKLSIILVAVTVIFFAGLYIYDYRVSHASFEDLEVSQIKTISVYSLSGMMKETLSEDEVAYLFRKGCLLDLEPQGGLPHPVDRRNIGLRQFEECCPSFRMLRLFVRRQLHFLFVRHTVPPFHHR